MKSSSAHMIIKALTLGGFFRRAFPPSPSLPPRPAPLPPSAVCRTQSAGLTRTVNRYAALSNCAPLRAGPKLLPPPPSCSQFGSGFSKNTFDNRVGLRNQVPPLQSHNTTARRTPTVSGSGLHTALRDSESKLNGMKTSPHIAHPCRG